MKKYKYSQMDADIDEELAHYIINLMEGEVGFVIAADIKRMVFFSDYTQTMNEYKRQQDKIMADRIAEIEYES